MKLKDLICSKKMPKIFILDAYKDCWRDEEKTESHFAPKIPWNPSSARLARWPPFAAPTPKPRSASCWMSAISKPPTSFPAWNS